MQGVGGDQLLDDSVIFLKVMYIPCFKKPSYDRIFVELTQLTEILLMIDSNLIERKWPGYGP